MSYSPESIISSRTPTDSAITVASSSATASSSAAATIDMAAPIVEVESSDNVFENTSSHAPTSTSNEEMELRELRSKAAKAAEDAPAAADARRLLVEARSSRASSIVTSNVTSGCPSRAAEHIDIGDDTVPSADAIIQHGEMILPITEPATRVDQAREFWTSLSRAELVDPGRGSAEPTSARQADNLQHFHAVETPNIMDTDVRNLKVAGLYKQLQELERRTKPTRTSPEGSHHSGIELTKPKIVPPVKTFVNFPDNKPIIELKEVILPPGFERNDRAEYGTPEGSATDLLLGLQHPSPQRHQPDDWELNLDGLGEREINPRILKRLDRQAAIGHHAAMQRPLPDYVRHRGGHPRHHRDERPRHHRDACPRPHRDELPRPRRIRSEQEGQEGQEVEAAHSSFIPFIFFKFIEFLISSSHRASPPKIPSDKQQPVIVRVREAETIKLSALPEAPYWEGWRQQMYDDVAAASGVGHDIFSWLHSVQCRSSLSHHLRIALGFPEPTDVGRQAAQGGPEARFRCAPRRWRGKAACCDVARSSG